jgi:tRNA pseudouridine32 synthase/23S rRNA pseudouridine746 synthase
VKVNLADPTLPIDAKWHRFKTDINSYRLPEILDYPFYYQPHALAKHAARQLQDYLMIGDFSGHNFGLNPNNTELAIGKMFGILVVKNRVGEIGFLAAFSGKLGNSNNHSFFVPPVYDLLDQDGFFRTEEKEIVGLTKKIEDLKNNAGYVSFKSAMSEWEDQKLREMNAFKIQLKENKRIRDEKRKHLNELAEEDWNKNKEELNEQSKKEQLALKKMKRVLLDERITWNSQLALFDDEIERIENERSERSSSLQQRIFSEYTFLNAHSEEKSLFDIFKNHPLKHPPAGAGECSAPKLFQYAFKRGYEPIALAEFWWGKSPISDIRVHKDFYPACRGKCEPILTHMLKGLKVASNPMLLPAAPEQEIEVLYRDEHFAVINKPAELLSVPGKFVSDSVFTRSKHLFPHAEGPIIVHRLDMSTSGIMVLALTKKAHANLQRQFLKRTVKKTYLALLNGTFSEENGKINLPLRVDLDDRPRQLVCYAHGKKACTRWEVLKRNEKTTKVAFYPITGRTHQLRVHAAHALGLGTPIVGDDLYGTRNDRLYLHAWKIALKHPFSGEPFEQHTKDPF